MFLTFVSVYMVCFALCYLRPFALTNGFTLSWICQDTVVFWRVKMRNVSLLSLKFARWQREQKGPPLPKKEGRIFLCTQYFMFFLNTEVNRNFRKDDTNPKNRIFYNSGPKCANNVIPYRSTYFCSFSLNWYPTIV